MKHKNNQSLDTKITKQTPGHLRYTTLLSKDKKLCIDQHNVTSKNMGKEKLKEIKTNKYYSAPVSTKENGLVTRFKFHDKKEDTQRVRDKVDSTEFPEEKKISTKDRISKVTPNDSELDRSNFHSKKRSQASDYNIQNNKNYDAEIPKNEDIQKIFSDALNSPVDKVVHMSVINSFDNFEDMKKQIDSDRKPHEDEIEEDEEEDVEEDVTEGLDPEIVKSIQNINKEKLNIKAAVPILDFTQLPVKKPKKEEKKSEVGTFDDHDLASNSIASIFDNESHLDLSSKRLKKLILTSDFSSLVNLREEALKYREDREKDRINKLLSTQKISPRTGQAKATKLEKWVTKEKEEIRKTKHIIEEAKKKTEDVVKETQVNGQFLKQILSDKVTTPRGGASVRSGMNSSRRRYELKQKQAASEKDEAELADHDKVSSMNSRDQNHSAFDDGILDKLDDKDMEEMLERFGNKEIDKSDVKPEIDKSDLDVM